jgi:lysophospholipase L1-like esterase
VPKPAGTFRILSLGDSRTFGWGLSQEETYSGVLERLLQQKAGSAKRIEIINCGVNAWSYPQMLAYFRGDGLGFQPDMVLLAEANLWTQFSDKNSPQFVKQFMSRVRLKNFLRRFAIYHYVIEVKLKDFYERHRTRFIPVDPAQDALFKAQQQDNPESVFSDAIAGLCSLAVSNGIKPVLLYLPMADSLSASNTPPTLKVKSTISEQMGIPLVDLTPIIKPTGKELYLEADPVHYNARGNELIARRVFEIASPLIVP